MNRVGHDEGRHGKDERGHAQARGTLRRAMWKLVNRIDGSGSGAEQRRKLGQAIRASHDALAKLLGVNGYGCRIDILTATQSKVDVLAEPWANSGASCFSKYDIHFAPILRRAVLWRTRGPAKSQCI
jgi:hypothetical protein